MRWIHVDRHPAVSGNWGDPIYEKCPCGKDRRVDTKEHVELETISLEKLLERYGEAPCVAQHVVAPEDK